MTSATGYADSKGVSSVATVCRSVAIIFFGVKANGKALPAI